MNESERERINKTLEEWAALFPDKTAVIIIDSSLMSNCRETEIIGLLELHKSLLTNRLINK